MLHCMAWWKTKCLHSSPGTGNLPNSPWVF
uniref:Uncharacterized protein n=1 Tax=Anguilla anguilla TaxID=7936 RepID=A0A0E9R3W7_ANGAN